MKIAFCWSNVSGYVADCWHAMKDRVGFANVQVTCFAPSSNADAEFNTSLVEGLNVQWYDPNNYEKVAGALINFDPSAIVISGWNDPLYSKLYFDDRFSNVKKMMAIDNQRKHTLRQFLGKFAKRRLFRAVDGVMVPGERSWQLARYMGFEEDQIVRGTYGIDVRKYDQSLETRTATGSWPKSFLFVGRFAHAKSIDVLVEAYAKYRVRNSDNAWPLVTCGKGPLEHMIEDQPGIEHRGFIDPQELPTVLGNAGVFVLPSRSEPWGQVIVEAAAAGLPIICSQACGAGVELVHDLYNGLKVATDSVGQLCNALQWMHDHHSQLPSLGNNSRSLAGAYDKSVWCDKILNWLGESKVVKS